MNQPIQTLASHSPSNGMKQHPMHQQLHHTLQHQQQQPLVSTANANQQTMLQFHPTLQHPFSTMNHQQHLNNQQQHSNNTLHFGVSSMAQQQQQQQYNMNSDYSSSTYHIYDQISDLIIIKQQRMEKKRQEEKRRKMYLMILAGILLVGTFLFLIMQALFSSSSPTNAPSTTSSPALLSISSNQNNNNNNNLDTNAQMDIVSRASSWAPSFGPKTNQAGDRFDSRFQPPFGHSIRIPNDKSTMLTNKQVIQQSEACSGHGTVISPASLRLEVGGQAVCKCDLGFWGERCEFSATYGAQSNQQLLARCLLTNCNGNGQCNPSGKCLCLTGFFGEHCEYKMNQFGLGYSSPSQIVAIKQSPQTLVVNSPQTQQQQQQLSSQTIPQQTFTCNCGNGQCNQLTQKCKCYPGFTGESCQDRDLCFEQTCSDQGHCLASSGLCQCKFGYKGTNCELRDEELLQRLFNCSNHGKFDLNLRKCNCDQGYASFDCSEERCDAVQGNAVDCGQNGLFDCRHNKCVCQDGYSGERCQIQQCSAQCLRNGQCVEGACVCQPGYYGKHCSLNGCPNQCSARGTCVRVQPLAQEVAGASSSSALQPEWRCQCQAGSMGDDCGLPVERQCDDGIDNDRGKFSLLYLHLLG